jgi:ABC-2 type transport system permease protein
MNNLFTLIKANLINSWGINKVLKSKSKGEKLKFGLIGVLIVYAVAAAIFTVFITSYQLSDVLEKFNALELLISSSILSTTLFTIIMNSIKIPGYLFSFKDYDLLMSLPLKPSSILTSKMVFIYLSNFMIAIVVGIPPLIVYGIKSSGGVLYYSLVAVTTLFIPLIPIVIGAFFAYFLGRISAKFRQTNIILLVGSFLILILIMAVSTMASQIGVKQIKNSIPTVNALNDILFWTKWFINALKDNNIAYLAAFVLVSLIVFGIFTAIFAKGFKSINSKMSEKYKASNYKIERLKTSSVFKALYIKELKFYFSSYIYVLNTGFGVIMMTIFSVAIAFFGRDTVSKVLDIPMADKYLFPMITLIFVFCIIFTCTTASSISLEGKNLWIIKSLPIKIKNILWSKIFISLTLTVPAVIVNTMIIAIVFKLNALTISAMLSVSLMYSVFSPIIGILINLYLPKLEWTTQTAVVKQSASVLLYTFSGFLAIGIPIAIFAAIKPDNTNLYISIISVILFLINIILIKLLNTIGIRKFKEL